MCANLFFQIASVIGGLSIQKQRRLLKRKPEIIVATPGRLWELLQEVCRQLFPFQIDETFAAPLATLFQSEEGYLDGLKNIRFLVIDETDRMVEKGHFEELQFILEHLSQYENYQETY